MSYDKKPDYKKILEREKQQKQKQEQDCCPHNIKHDKENYCRECLWKAINTN